MPCNFAGMEGGCNHHQRFTAHDWIWTVPVFMLTRRDSPITEPDSSRIDELAELPELFPFYTKEKWSFRLGRRYFNNPIQDAVGMFLDGFADSDNEGSDKASLQLSRYGSVKK